MLISTLRCRLDRHLRRQKWQVWLHRLVKTAKLPRCRQVLRPLSTPREEHHVVLVETRLTHTLFFKRSRTGIAVASSIAKTCRIQHHGSALYGGVPV